MENFVLITPKPIIVKRKITIRSMCQKSTGSEGIHIHNYTHIWYALAGTCKHIVGDKIYLQKPGDCVVIPALVPHRIDSTESEETPVILSVCINDEFLTSRGYRFCSYGDSNVYFQRYRIPRFCELSGENKEKADTLARSMLSEFSSYSAECLDKIALLLERLLRLLCEENKERILTDVHLENVKRINSAMEYMEEHYSEKITLNDLGRLTALSHYGFTKKFRELTGITAMDYLNRLRIYRTQHLLLFTEKSLREIADDVGYYDKSRLIRAFRDSMKMSPTEYRIKRRPMAYQADFNSKKGRDFIRELSRNADF